MKDKRILIAIVITIIVICFYHYNFGFDKAFSRSSELLKLLFLFIASIIALKVYDRFGINKKITEKRIDLIIELLTELKNLYFRGDKQLKNGMINRPFYVSKNIDKYLSELDEEILKSKVVFYLEDKDNAVKKIIELINNPIMPKGISNKLQFLKMQSGVGTKNENIIKIYFSKLGAEKIKDGQWVVEYMNDCSLKEYIEKYKSTFIEIETWVKDHSDLKDELNI